MRYRSLPEFGGCETDCTFGAAARLLAGRSLGFRVAVLLPLLRDLEYGDVCV